MRTERKAQGKGASKSDEPANTDSPPATGMQDRTGLGDDQPPPLAEHFFAVQWATDPWSSLDDRSERIAALQSAISDGTYQVSPEQTAEAILAEQQVRDGTAA